MNREKIFLLSMSLMTTLGLCVTANIAYINWVKAPISNEKATISITDPVSEEGYKSAPKKARHSYAS